MRRFGKEKNHIELAVACADHGHEARAYDFFRSEADFSTAVLPGVTAALFATLERDSFRGGFALRLVDIKAL